MTTASALDRSPSASESELSLESPRENFLDNIRSSIAADFEKNLQAERRRFEAKISAMQEVNRMLKFFPRLRLKNSCRCLGAPKGLGEGHLRRSEAQGCD